MRASPFQPLASSARNSRVQTRGSPSGVSSSFIHYLLILLVALTIVVGALVAGSVLVTALLVLPGATALLLSDRLLLIASGDVIAGVDLAKLKDSDVTISPDGKTMTLTTKGANAKGEMVTEVMMFDKK